MANLKEVRNRITSVSSTQQITKAMKMVSAAKLKRATNAIVQLRPYANKLKDILANLSASLEESTSPFMQEREPAKVQVKPPQHYLLQGLIQFLVNRFQIQPARLIEPW